MCGGQTPPRAQVVDPAGTGGLTPFHLTPFHQNATAAKAHANLAAASGVRPHLKKGVTPTSGIFMVITCISERHAWGQTPPRAQVVRPRRDGGLTPFDLTHSIRTPRPRRPMRTWQRPSGV